jgi:transposase
LVRKGTWGKILAAVADDPDLDYLMVDGSIVRVHQHGAAKKQQPEQAIGKSRGGLSTKIHAAVDALGHPVRLLLTAGQVSEYTQAEDLIEGFKPGYVLADKGYDSDRFISAIAESQAIPVIPSKRKRKIPRA